MTEKIRILTTNIDACTITEALDKIEEMIAQPIYGSYIVTANAEIIYMAAHDAKLQAAIDDAAFVTADGSGAIWAAKELGKHLPQRVTGIDLVYQICRASAEKNWRIYIIGSAEGVAATAADKLREMYPGCQIVGTHHGYLQDKAVEQAAIEDIREKQPDILLVAMGAPRQENWIKQHAAQLRIPVSMGIGGSMDVISGNLKRAPKWMQKMSLEWLYRLIKQPSRWRRMLALPKFMLAVKKQKR